MASIVDVAVALGGPASVAVAAWIAARAQRASAMATRRATDAETSVTESIEHRKLDQQTYERAQERTDRDLAELRDRVRDMERDLRMYDYYVGQLTAALREAGVQPPEPPWLLHQRQSSSE